jgi:hypothetical protein
MAACIAPLLGPADEGPGGARSQSATGSAQPKRPEGAQAFIGFGLVEKDHDDELAHDGPLFGFSLMRSHSWTVPRTDGGCTGDPGPIAAGLATGLQREAEGDGGHALKGEVDRKD